MKEWLPLIGVVIAQFVLVGLYFLKQFADDKRRWHQKRLDVYSSFVIDHLAMIRALPIRTHHPITEEEKELLSSQRDALLGLLFEVQLIGTRAVIDASEGMVDALSELERARTESAVQWVEQHQNCNRARHTFQESVRKELGVKSPRKIDVPRLATH